MLETLTDALFQMEICHVWKCHLWTKQEGRPNEAEACYRDVNAMLEHYRRLYPKSHKYEINEGKLTKDGKEITL